MCKKENNFYDELLDVFILIEENTMESTSLAISKFQILWKKETKENICRVKSNLEMRKSYNAFYDKKL